MDIRTGTQLFYVFPEYWNEWDEQQQRDTFNLKVRVMETPDQWGPSQDSIENANVAVEIKGQLEERKTDWDGYAYYNNIPPGLYDINITFDELIALRAAMDIFQADEVQFVAANNKGSKISCI